jgi:hypothetical protein
MSLKKGVRRAAQVVAYIPIVLSDAFFVLNYVLPFDPYSFFIFCISCNHALYSAG